MEHLLRDLPVQAAHAVAVGRSVQRQNGHGEPLVAVEDVAPAERHQLLKVDADFGAIPREVVVHQARIEEIDSGGNRRVSGENIAGARGFQGFFEGQFPVAHQQAHLLQREKRGVAFVHVVHGGLQAHGLERPHILSHVHPHGRT